MSETGRKRVLRPWTAAEVHRAAQMRRAGATHKEIAAALGRRWGAVKARLYQAGCTAPVRRLTPAVRRRLLAMAARGLYQRRMARELGVSSGTLARWVAALGLELPKGHRGTCTPGQAERIAMRHAERRRSQAAALGWPEARTPHEARVLGLLAAEGPLRAGRIRERLGGKLVTVLRRLLALRMVERLGAGPNQTYRVSAWLLEGREAS